jgi:3-hydroxyisobutyrate dehydrogenase-like beta-hydroxyacid dehydrogenase
VPNQLSGDSGEVPYSTATKVGSVGLGDMGGPITKAILRRFPIIAFDLRQEALDNLVAAGAQSAASLHVLADSCEVAVVTVVTDKQVETVVGEFLAHPGKLRDVIICSTILPATVIKLHEKAVAAGSFNVIDAPVSGGGEKAEKGIISILVGGDAAAVKRSWPILEAFGKDIFHLGPAGAGATGKLITNMMSLGTNMLLLEAMELGRAHGVTEDAIATFLPTTSGDSRVIRTWGRYDRMRRTHTLAGTDAMYGMFAKDMGIAAAAAGAQGVVLPLASALSGMIIEKAKKRDKFLADNNMLGPIPRCPVCTLELGFPYQAAGVHPDCALEQEQ